MLTIPGCRPFHIYVDDVMCRAHKIEYERSINVPFTVIYAPGTNLKKKIMGKNGIADPFPKNPLRREKTPPSSPGEKIGPFTTESDGFPI